jgi:hypothetical protein
VASVVGTILFVIVLVAALGAQEYMSSLQAESSQVAQQAQQLLDRHGSESLVYSSPAAGLTVTNRGGVSINLVDVVLKFADGTVYTFQGDTSLPSGASVLVASLIPEGNCGEATCVQRYDSIVSGGAPGSMVGLVTSLGNTFWNPCVTSASSSGNTPESAEGTWTSYDPVWVLNSSVPWMAVYNVFVSNSGLVVIQAGSNGVYQVGLTGAVTQTSSGDSYPPDTPPISDSSAYGTYVIVSAGDGILVLKNGSALQTLTLANDVYGYAAMDISANGQYIVYAGRQYIELFRGQGDSAPQPSSSSSASTGLLEGNWTSWKLFTNTTITIDPAPDCPEGSVGPGFQFITGVAANGMTYIALEGENGGFQMAVNSTGSVIYCVRLDKDLQIASPAPLFASSAYGTYSAVGVLFPLKQGLSFYDDGALVQNMTGVYPYSIGMDPTGRYVAILTNYQDGPPTNFTLSLFKGVGTYTVSTGSSGSGIFACGAIPPPSSSNSTTTVPNSEGDWVSYSLAAKTIPGQLMEFTPEAYEVDNQGNAYIYFFGGQVMRVNSTGAVSTIENSPLLEGSVTVSELFSVNHVYSIMAHNSTTLSVYKNGELLTYVDSSYRYFYEAAISPNAEWIIIINPSASNLSVEIWKGNGPPSS